MATTFTREQYDRLRDAIAVGAFSVTHRGKTITYRSLREMYALLNRMEVSLGIRNRVGVLGGTRESRPPINYD